MICRTTSMRRPIGAVRAAGCALEQKGVKGGRSSNPVAASRRPLPLLRGRKSPSGCETFGVRDNKALQTALEEWRRKPLPETESDDEGIADLWSDLVDFDAWAAGLVSRVASVTELWPYELKTDAELRARMEARLTDRDSVVVADARALLGHLTELEALIALAQRTRRRSTSALSGERPGNEHLPRARVGWPALTHAPARSARTRRAKSRLGSGIPATRRRRNRTFQAPGCDALLVLKTRSATRPVPPRPEASVPGQKFAGIWRRRYRVCRSPADTIRHPPAATEFPPRDTRGPRRGGREGPRPRAPARRCRARTRWS